KILYQAGCRDIIVADSKGAIYRGRADLTDDDSSSKNYNPYRHEIATRTNLNVIIGNLADIIKGADVFIGVSGRGSIVSKDMVDSMNHDAIVFALSNPDPEILPSDALQAGARIVATGRSDFPNQVNNAVVFPSLLRSLLDLRAKNINEDMLAAVAYAIANLVDNKHLAQDFIVPKITDPRIMPTVTQTLKEALMTHMGTKS
ncbi:MAG: NAD-dependent malic enzyme, partial [Thaumarchaeota archaeon]